MFVPIVKGVAVPHSTILARFRTCDLSLTGLKHGLGLLWIQLTKGLHHSTTVFTLPVFVVYLLL